MRIKVRGINTSGKSYEKECVEEESSFITTWIAEDLFKYVPHILTCHF
jgi:hypothetical protein